MKRGSKISDPKLNSANKIINLSRNSVIFLKDSRTLSSLHSGFIKKSISLISNIKEVIPSLKINNNKNPFIKSKFSNIENKNEQINNYKMFKNYTKPIDYNYMKDLKIDETFLFYRKIIYKKAILEKYTSPYLKLDCNKNEIYIKEWQLPRLFHSYLINYILQKKKCKLLFRFNEMIKNIDENDYLTYNYDIRQSYDILLYLINFIYNNDKYTYNKIIDERNNKERILIHYNNTLENIINIYNKHKFENFNFMLNNKVSKMNQNDYKYYFNNRYYKYLFIEEIPIINISNIIPNYLGFEIQIKKCLKNYIDNYKYKKIKIKNIKKEKQNNISQKSQDKYEEKKDEKNEEKHYINNENSQDYDREIYDKIRQNYSLSSFESEDELFPISLYTKNKINNINKRIKKNADIIEIEGLLDNFNANNNIKKSLKRKNKKVKNLESLKNNNNISNESKINKTEIEKKFIGIKTNNVMKKNTKEQNVDFPSIIQSYNDKKNKNSINNITNSLKSKNKNNKSLSYRGEKNIVKKNIHMKKSQNQNLDFKKLVLDLISNKKYTYYNKKYNYDCQKEINNMGKCLTQKEENNLSIKSNNKFKITTEFMKDFKNNKKILYRNNMIINNLIVEKEYNKNMNRKKENSNYLRDYLTNRTIRENNEFSRYINKINIIFRSVDKKKAIENSKKNKFYQNVKNSKELIKYGDIYF